MHENKNNGTRKRVLITKNGPIAVEATPAASTGNSRYFSYWQRLPSRTMISKQTRRRRRSVYEKWATRSYLCSCSTNIGNQIWNEVDWVMKEDASKNSVCFMDIPVIYALSSMAPKFKLRTQDWASRMERPGSSADLPGRAHSLSAGCAPRTYDRQGSRNCQMLE